MSNPYVVLGVRPTADADQIKAAYRKRVRRFHPDQAHGDPILLEKLQIKMADLNAAYEELTRPPEEDDALTDEPPKSATTYMRLINDDERAEMERFAKISQRTISRRRLSRQLSFQTPPPKREPVFLSAIRVDATGLQLAFEGQHESDHIMMVLPKLVWNDREGRVTVSTEATKCINTSDAGRDRRVQVDNAAPFVEGFDGPAQLQFET